MSRDKRKSMESFLFSFEMGRRGPVPGIPALSQHLLHYTKKSGVGVIIDTSLTVAAGTGQSLSYIDVYAQPI